MNAGETKIFDAGNTLAKVIEANTGVANLQSDVFLFQASISGTVSGTATGSRRGMAGPAGPFAGGTNGIAGITVDLEDTDGDVLATTVTDARGRYTLASRAARPPAWMTRRA